MQRIFVRFLEESLARENRFGGLTKGQLISKANCQAEDSSKKRTNEFVFTSMQHVFVRFLEESLARKKTFGDYLTFSILFQKSDKL